MQGQPNGTPRSLWRFSNYSVRTVIATLFVVLSFSISAFAQSTVTGDITGTIVDPTNAALTSAKITLQSDTTGEINSANVNSQGQFRLALLRPGAYTIKATAVGFQDTNVKVNVSLGQVVPVTIRMGLQTQSQSVSVSSEAPLLQNENANLATTFNQVQLENLPAPGNDMTSYAFTAPGVTVSTGGGYGNFSVFGLPGVSNLFTINGSDNMDPYLNLNNSGASNLTLGSNEIQEAAVVINGYTGQYGRQAGAQVNYVTKSGTNAFHGNAAFWYNEDKMNANDFFNNSSGTARPFAISRSWADSVGGPILKNKAFFFFDNEGLRYVLPGGGPVYIPTTDFASYVQTNVAKSNPGAASIYQTALGLYGGSTGAARATAVPITAGDPGGCGDFSDTASGFGITKPCARTFQNTANNLNTEWLMAIRGDYNFTSNDRMYARYNTDHGVQATGTDPINPAFNANSVQPSYGGQIGYTRTLGASMINDLRLSGSWYSALFGPPNLASSLAAFPTTWAFSDGDYNNVGGGDNTYPQGRRVGQWQIIDDFSYTRGKHEIKVGLNYRYNFVSTLAYGPNTSGLLTFNSMTDFVNGSLANGSNFSQAFATVGAEPLRMYSAGFYGQDTWRISPKFTATLAIRFDRNSDITCKFNCFAEVPGSFASINHDVTQPYNSVIKTGVNQALPSVEPVVVAPRFGLAYNISKSTVVRGGFGIFSDLYQGLIADRFITNAPQVATFTATSGTAAFGGAGSSQALAQNSFNAFENGFKNGATLAQLQASVPGFSKPTFNTLGGELYNPKYYEWNIEVQQALGTNYVITLNYVGNHGHDEFVQSAFPNQYSTKGFGGLPTTAPDARFGEIRELTNNGRSNYDGMVASVKWRVTSSLTGIFNYTWSHSLDTVSNAGLEPYNINTSLRYLLSPTGNLNYSNSDNDVRNAVSANFVYTVPKKFSNRMLSGALSGWTVASVTLYHSGYPLSVTDSGVRSPNGVLNATGLTTQSFLAYFLGSSTPPVCSTPNVSCWSKSNFQTGAQQTTWGNLPRNSFRGPGYVDSDLTVNKTFSVINERYKLLVGANFFNLFNHANFAPPGISLTSGTFGQILSTVSAPTSAYGSFQGSAVSGRVIQTQVKFTF